MTLSVCAEILTDGTVKAFPYEPLANCTFVVVSNDDYRLMDGRARLEFDIDATFYSEITGYLLLSFLSGHVLGRIVKGLGKA
ncbi:TPA: hypothetical protein ACX3GK_000477 [Vibrio parahaemolyticus]|uniref:Uncharacterized protein n=1 Tax=Vibrio parahaemolyticus TaxID=670 RepID=A0A8H9MW59_VIBPH|nr:MULTISPECIES: hypothetical protein [Vibrio harveyi group]EGQ9919750.1 hypothetical protein [Vibrio parahaemolyticus]EIE9608977.1 hypothetical protein [Vibrio parahaemolyticus]EII3139124.1 hypothetical protein [Vibrio parahaemolyticus]EJC7033443.1 hypothetical protein [Vibrio parahaemolyticus]ELJ8822593.1 hypothetical protein [Vibrio parahaemolyticus]